VETELEVAGFDPEEWPPTTHRLVLEQGLSVHGEALSRKQRPLEGVRLRLEREGEPPPMLIADPAVVEAKQQRWAVSDTSGHVWISGLYPGRYRASAEPAWSEAASRSVQLRQLGGGPYRDVIEIELRDQQVELELREVPAARLTGHLLCDDGGPLPELLSVEVVRACGLEQRQDPAGLLAQSELSRRVPLTGRLQDSFEVGPLPLGVWLAALRPAGFQRWTWARGTEDPKLAWRILVESPDVLDLGTVELKCGPLVVVRPRVLNGDPLPDLRDATVKARWHMVDPEGDGESGGFDVLHREEVIELYGAPPGETRLEVSLSHPHFLPGASVELKVTEPLVRGGLTILKPELAATGASMEVQATGGVVRLEPAEEGREPRSCEVIENACVMENLVPGGYGLKLCEDPACSVQLAAVDELLLEPAMHLKVQLGGGEP
jgi:hypothetical protein